MTALAALFIDKSCQLLRADYLPKIERCLGAMSDADIWWRPNEASNSAGNLVLHLSGNVRQWIVGGVGQRPFERDRQREFDERGPHPRDELLRGLRAAVAEADEIIGGLDAVALSTRRQIQDRDVTVLEAVYHMVEHFGMHTGQIILLAKLRTGEDLRLWQPRAATP